ncbi:MAG: FecR domain-containing protein [Polyangiaceae bacterium]
MSHDDDTRSYRFGDPNQLRVEDHLVDLMEGTASDEVLDLVAGSDAYRDARFEAEQAARVAEASGADFQLPTDFEARVMALHDERFPEAKNIATVGRPMEGAAEEPPPPAPMTAPLWSTEDEAPAGAVESEPVRETLPPMTQPPMTQPPITQPLGAAGLEHSEAPQSGETAVRSGQTQPEFAPLEQRSSGITAVRSGQTEIDAPALADHRAARAPADQGPAQTEETLLSAQPVGKTEVADSADLADARGSAESIVESSIAPRGSHAERASSPHGSDARTGHPNSSGQAPVASSVPADKARDGARGSELRAQANAKPRGSRRGLYIAGGGVLALAAAAAFTLVQLKGTGSADEGPLAGWHGSVSETVGSGLSVCDAEGANCAAAKDESEVEAGRVLRTDPNTQAKLKLSDGSWLTLDRSTEVALVAGEARHAKLVSGRVAADVAKVEGKLAHITLPQGKIEVLGTKFAITALGNSASVDVSRGAVKLMDTRGREVVVRAGEEGRLDEGIPPYAASAPTLGEALAWSDLQGPDEKEQHDVRGLGELRAKKPGEKDERKGAVRLTSHEVKVRMVGQLARTEVEEVFSNETDETLEGIFRFPIPPDAKIERLALEVDGKLEEGAFVDRERAAAIWRGSIVNAAPQARKLIRDEIIWVPGPWRDPALLEWQRGGRFELRIFPIPKRGSRRVVLAYSQVLKPTGGVRRYIYPLAHDPSGSTEVDRFGIDLQVKGNDPAFGVRTIGYELSSGTSPSDSTRKTFDATQFRPAGDLVVEYALPNREQELTAWAYKPTAEDLKGTADKDPSGTPNDAAYVALALRPKLPRSVEGAQRDFAIVVDSSRSMFGERYERAAALTSRVIRELDGQDRVTVLACDQSCRTMAGGLLPPGAQTAAAAKKFLEAEAPEGGSDVCAAVDAARQAVPRDPARSLRVVYIGDGTPTVGAIKPAYIEQWVKRTLPSADGTLTTVAIGTDSDLDTLGALSRAGGGVVLPFVPGQRLSEAAFGVLGATYGSSLSDVRVELPSGLTEVAPNQLDSIVAGGEELVVARMAGDSVSGSVVLRGKVGGKDFEQRYPLQLTARSERGNTFVPRLFAAAKIADLERETGPDARKQAVELSQRFDVASRFTSLLVLESPAMFKAFGLDNSRALPDWSGEEDVSAVSAKGDLDVADEEAPESEAELADRAAEGGFGLGSIGSGAGASKSASAGAPLRAAPAPTSAPQARPAPASKPKPSAPRMDPSNPWGGDPFDDKPAERWRPPPRRMVPMRRIFERTGTVVTDRLVPKAATPEKIAEADRDVQADGNRRNAVKQLYTLLALSGNFDRARGVADQWSDKDPLDPEALTARADLLAEDGQRDRAVRLLGSVIDVRPDDVAGQKRLARLFRWSGRPEQGCRFSLAIAQIKNTDPKLLAEAVSCARQTGVSWMAERMLDSVDARTKTSAEALAKKLDTEEKLSGDFRVEANWSGGDTDLDLALLHPDGHRVSWLGAPTRSIITATDVTSTSREGLALRGAKAGEYVVEVVRASGSGPVSGTVTVSVAGTKKQIPFTLDGQRRTLGVVTIGFKSRLVPVRGWGWR